MTLRLDDLPAAARAQALALVGEQPRAPRPPGTVGARGPRYCCACGEKFDGWGKAIERHMDEHGHHRADVILETP